MSPGKNADGLPGLATIDAHVVSTQCRGQLGLPGRTDPQSEQAHMFLFFLEAVCASAQIAKWLAHTRPHRLFYVAAAGTAGTAVAVVTATGTASIGPYYWASDRVYEYGSRCLRAYHYAHEGPLRAVLLSTAAPKVYA